MVILAMGKMGAFELNYSSDIDLVVFYDEDRFPSRAPVTARSGRRPCQRPGQAARGTNRRWYVFRVDLRLRPDAGATQIAIPTAVAELYYESMGQNWERAAWIKARQCAGRSGAGRAFLKSMEPFIWRKYLDYAAIQDIHSIKRQIHSHAGHGRIAVSGHNIKLGRGGIREIEFFAQTQQLIWAAAIRACAIPRRSERCARFSERGHISAEAEHDLADAYRFLRRVEHRLQMIDDQQTHTLPKTPDGLDHVARFAASTTRRVRGDAAREAHHGSGRIMRGCSSARRRCDLTGSLVSRASRKIPKRRDAGTHGLRARRRRLSGHSRLASRPHQSYSERARPRALTKLMPALLEALARTADPDCGVLPFRPLPVRTSFRRAGFLDAAGEPTAARSDRRDCRLGAAPRRLPRPASKRARRIDRSGISQSSDNGSPIAVALHRRTCSRRLPVTKPPSMRRAASPRRKPSVSACR
jgi:glutamate-ammonia-ligase adenylyltransferase